MYLTTELLQLAKDPSPPNRRDLLRQITDLFFLEENERSISEENLFEEVIWRLFEDIDLSGRMEFAERISDREDAPHNIVLYLARNEIAIAWPVLARSRVLTDADLIGIVATAEDRAIQAVSERPSLSEDVTDVLIARGSQLVARTLVNNDGARFSRGGFSKLVARSEEDEVLQMGLACREDLPPEIATKLAPFLSEKIQRSLVERGLALPKYLSKGMLEALRARMEMVSEERSHETKQVRQIVADLKAGRATIDCEIIDLAKADRAFDLATLVAELCCIEHAVAMKTLTGTNDETLIVLFRMIGADSNAFESALQLRARRQRKLYVRSASLMRAFEDMDGTTAQRVMRFLAVRKQT